MLNYILRNPSNYSLIILLMGSHDPHTADTWPRSHDLNLRSDFYNILNNGGKLIPRLRFTSVFFFLYLNIQWCNYDDSKVQFYEFFKLKEEMKRLLLSVCHNSLCLYSGSPYWRQEAILYGHVDDRVGLLLSKNHFSQRDINSIISLVFLIQLQIACAKSYYWPFMFYWYSCYIQYSMFFWSLCRLKT